MDYIFLIDVDFAQSRHHARHKFGCLGVTFENWEILSKSAGLVGKSANELRALWKVSNTVHQNTSGSDSLGHIQVFVAPSETASRLCDLMPMSQILQTKILLYWKRKEKKNSNKNNDNKLMQDWFRLCHATLFCEILQ